MAADRIRRNEKGGTEASGAEIKRAPGKPRISGQLRMRKLNKSVYICSKGEYAEK